MIHERRRLIPTMIAVIIGVAFVASTLMLMDSIKAYTLRIQAAAVGDATAVVTAKEPSKPMSSMTVDKVAAVPGVTSVEQTRNAFLQRTDNGQASFVNGHLVPAHPHLVKGRAPAKLDEVAVNQSTADNNAGIGSKIIVNDPPETVRSPSPSPWLVCSTRTLAPRPPRLPRRSTYRPPIWDASAVIPVPIPCT